MRTATWWRSGAGALLLAGCLACGVLGCGGGSQPANTAGEETTGEEETVASGKPTKSSGRPKTKPTVGDGIPVNVWFDDPIDEANKTGGTAVVADASPTAKPSEAMDAPEAKPPAEEPETKPAGGGGDWATLISGDQIADEAKQIRARLVDSLSTVGKYNSHYKDLIQIDGAVLAAIAGVALQHPDKVSWKEKAGYVRDLASGVADKAKGLGGKPYEETQKVFEQLNQILDGSIPEGVETPAPEMPFSEVAKRSGIMKRMEKTFQYMKSTITNAAALEKESDKIVAEAALLATLAKVVSTDGYASADEEEYQTHVKAMIAANQEIIEAVKNKNFDAFTAANGKNQKVCDDCHLAYRFAE